MNHIHSILYYNCSEDAQTSRLRSQCRNEFLVLVCSILFQCILFHFWFILDLLINWNIFTLRSSWYVLNNNQSTQLILPYKFKSSVRSSPGTDIIAKNTDFSHVRTLKTNTRVIWPSFQTHVPSCTPQPSASATDVPRRWAESPNNADTLQTICIASSRDKHFAFLLRALSHKINSASETGPPPVGND